MYDFKNYKYKAFVLINYNNFKLKIDLLNLKTFLILN